MGYKSWVHIVFQLYIIMIWPFELFHNQASAVVNLRCHRFYILWWVIKHLSADLLNPSPIIARRNMWQPCTSINKRKDSYSTYSQANMIMKSKFNNSVDLHPWFEYMTSDDNRPLCIFPLPFPIMAPLIIEWTSTVL